MERRLGGRTEPVHASARLGRPNGVDRAVPVVGADEDDVDVRQLAPRGEKMLDALSGGNPADVFFLLGNLLLMTTLIVQILRNRDRLAASGGWEDALRRRLPF